MNWTTLLLDQLTFHWDHQVRPGLADLTDDEYHWEPVPGMWGIRPRAEARGAMAAGGGELVADFEFPEPTPVPLTTIAWRLGHVIVGIFGMRNAAHFGGPPMDYETVVWPGTAAEALAMLDAVYAGWIAGVAAMDDARLAEPVGEAEGDFAEYPYAALVLHIHREAIHHLAEVALLRDLYRAQH
ncbi:MAG: DinB family protein [Acidimicrobiales bacterium]|nr:DinB family protein [Acidimicrobiales bacterium]MCB9392890.1 DinB family protein [Acidimicrobiaceae bacterium]